MNIAMNFNYKGNKIFIKNNVIYLKPKWRCQAKKIMYKPVGQFGRWTQLIKKKYLTGELIPFYFTPISKLASSGVNIIISIVKDKGHTEELIIQIDDILNSPKKIGNGLLAQILFDPNFKHLKKEI